MDSNNNNSNTDSDNDNDIPELEVSEPEPVEQTNNPFTENIIIYDDAITDLFIRMFNNPRFTGRANYRFHRQ